MDDSGRYPGAVTKVPRVHCGLRCAWDRGWAFDVNRGVPADAARDPVPGVAVIPCRKTDAPRMAEGVHHLGMTTEIHT